ncbi:aminoglycoside 6-adenylyltransferase [Paenibacillus sp.]|uniref:aminoglycoside 6-adenylyltransferase n=1 Tax=Paenibacillus sp. TaxID=58172 RepID=UPI002D51A588|nr:aminoglycoside 6-adenylyltransferase [Paenibacillus sp.]HZG57218.1 aminoglycoside 6-adenylyltransferase [Paenibacillus sp.]
MRNEQEMIDAILGFAKEDDRVRAVVLNGSRANPCAPKDMFQDYDVLFLVTSVMDFVRERDWIRRRFGEWIIMQTPDEHDRPDAETFDRFAYLMLFADGNRIDLTFYPVARLDELRHESLSVKLLDKDGIVGTLPPPSIADHRTRPPTETRYAQVCNEFWWVSTYVAKGLWRRELPYAKTMLEQPVRDALLQMLRWHVGVRTGFAADPGKAGKYLENVLEPRLWQAFVCTYPDADYDRIWDALFAMCALFRETALEIAGHCGFGYPEGDDRRVTEYLRRVRALPRDAVSFGGKA